jgi:hypothetical protein
LIAKKPGRRRGTIFGDALQAARDLWEAQATDPNRELPGRDLCIAQALAEVELGYGEIMPKDQEQADELEIERVKVRVMVRQYIVRYGLQARREVEYESLFPHPKTGRSSRTFVLAGKIDGVQKIGDRVALVVEDKFVGQIQKAMIDRLPLDAQSSEYVDALLRRGWEAQVAYRHTRYPGLNPEKAKTYKTKEDKPAEPLADFEVRLAEDVLDRPEFYFDEQILIFPKHHLDEYESERWVVGEMIKNARALQKGEGISAWPKNPSRCWEFGGCEFIPLCTQRDGAMDLYEVVDDSPELSAREDVASEYAGT